MAVPTLPKPQRLYLKTKPNAAQTAWTFLLPHPKKRHPISVGTITDDGVLFKRFKERDHTLWRHPGTGLNLEMVCRIDHGKRPDVLELRYSDGSTDVVSWETVRAYAHDVVENGEGSRYYLKDDVDTQVLIPWAAFEHEAAGGTEGQVADEPGSTEAEDLQPALF